MTTDQRYVYTKPAGASQQPWHLVANSDGTGESRFAFNEHLEIGRHQEGELAPPGCLLICDPTISRRHCSIRRAPDGSCLLRDTSRNGTWLDGRRLVPNIEVPIRIGQTITVGKDHRFVLDASADSGVAERRIQDGSSTLHISVPTSVTVLVGDIRDYTVLVQRVAPEVLQTSVGRIFERLERVVARHDGSIKEYPGDAIFAFWERRHDSSHAVSACRAALALDDEANRMAADESIWGITGFPLKMDWALATGSVVIQALGEGQPTGLLMIGEAVVLAFRMEKFADAVTGSILACERTVALAGDSFEWRDLGVVKAKGFESPKRLFALLRERRGNAP